MIEIISAASYLMHAHKRIFMCPAGRRVLKLYETVGDPKANTVDSYDLIKQCLSAVSLLSIKHQMRFIYAIGLLRSIQSVLSHETAPI